jgi:type II secretory pathway pseudopilin PulG
MPEPKEKERTSSAVIVIVVVVVVIVVLIAVPNLLPSKGRGSHEGSAISSLRTLSSVEAQYVTRFDTYTGLATLCNTGLIDSVLGNGAKSGYIFHLEFDGNSSWKCTARPSEWGVTGERNFVIETDGTIRYNAEKDSNTFTKKLGD